MSDSIYQKGFRTQAAYYLETDYGTPLIGTSAVLCRRISGNVKNVNWQSRQQIIQTGNVGEGRNYTQQLFGTFDVNGSVNFEVATFDFLRFAMGDIAKLAGGGTTETSPKFIVQAELSGTDSTGYETLDANTDAYTTIRLRPFSLLLYDDEAGAGADGLDLVTGCMLNNFTLTASAGTPLQCSANFVGKNVIRYRDTSGLTAMPNFASTTKDAGFDILDNHVQSMDPSKSAQIAGMGPLMFQHGQIYYNGNVLGQVQSFNYSYDNGLLVYRSIGSRFINMPQTGKIKQSLSMNVILAISTDTNMIQGLPSGYTSGVPTFSGSTSIQELIRNYFSYPSSGTWLAASGLNPSGSAIGTAVGSSYKPVEYYINLKFTATDPSGNARGATLNVYYASVEGFGLPIQLDNGLIEVPITFSVRGMPYAKTAAGDGSFGGHTGTGTGLGFTATNILDNTTAGLHPILTWWHSL